MGNGGGYDGKIEVMKKYNDNLLISSPAALRKLMALKPMPSLAGRGTEWTTFGDGLNGTVYDLTFFGGGQIIAVGDFTVPGDELGKRNIALWDGENWQSE